MSGTGNTTVPSDPASRSSSAPADPLGFALAICHCADAPGREGEVAFLDPDPARTTYVGRFLPCFLRQRSGETVDCGPLGGVKISQEQFRFTCEGDGVRIHNVGRATVFVDGTELPQDTSTFIRVGAVIEVVGHSVLVLTRRPRTMPRPHPGMLPLQPFGQPCPLGITGESAQAWEQRADTLHAATAERNVLIYGPTGTGKELVARGIHARSSRARGPFVAVNCAQLNHGVTAYELFGGPKNWPNPGTPESEGHFGAARGGTLFLDEIGELAEELQSPLLRALEGGYNRVGESRARQTQCIVIGATNRGEVGVKQDVRMRFTVVVVCHALSERREDIAQILLQRLLERARKESDVGKRFLKPDAQGTLRGAFDVGLIVGLLRSPLPGNVRELDIILGMSIAAAGDEELLRWPRRLALPAPATLVLRKEPREATAQEILSGLDRRPEPPTSPPPPFGERPDPGPELLLETLRAYDWNYTAAAAALGITDDKLYRLRKKYGIQRPV